MKTYCIKCNQYRPGCVKGSAEKNSWRQRPPDGRFVSNWPEVDAALDWIGRIDVLPSNAVRWGKPMRGHLCDMLGAGEFNSSTRFRCVASDVSWVFVESGYWIMLVRLKRGRHAQELPARVPSQGP